MHIPNTCNLYAINGTTRILVCVENDIRKDTARNFWSKEGKRQQGSGLRAEVA